MFYIYLNTVVGGHHGYEYMHDSELDISSVQKGNDEKLFIRFGTLTSFDSSVESSSFVADVVGMKKEEAE